MPNQPPLNPDAIHQLFAVAMIEVLDAEKLQPGNRLAHVNDIQEVLNRLEKNVLTVAQPVVNSAEELDALPQETVIRSVIFGVVRERLDSGWLATGADEFESTDEIAGRDHVVLHRPEVNDA
ncbi:MAG: hypothetical protein ACTICQ_15170 [Glutamicibacter arilaitensis]|uniref:hypothetical protein n=1 Tax=Glutamicibacter arilaitensis TaxID=256701 RepID=UPI003FB90FFA